jgi:2-polyprenyl-6-methoxyphenol hydroxylase-like FAD-dependent oxidoreductase
MQNAEVWWILLREHNESGKSLGQVSKRKSTRPVLIVGAGPTGMTAAIELNRFGIPVRLIDKLLEPITTSRAIGVQARTLELLEQRGLADAMLEAGNKDIAGSIYGHGKLLFRMEFSGIDSSYRYLLGISQADTERILRERLAARESPLNGV